MAHMKMHLQQYAKYNENFIFMTCVQKWSVCFLLPIQVCATLPAYKRHGCYRVCYRLNDKQIVEMTFQIIKNIYDDDYLNASL